MGFTIMTVVSVVLLVLWLKRRKEVIDLKAQLVTEANKTFSAVSQAEIAKTQVRTLKADLESERRKNAPVTTTVKNLAGKVAAAAPKPAAKRPATVAPRKTTPAARTSRSSYGSRSGYDDNTTNNVLLSALTLGLLDSGSNDNSSSYSSSSYGGSSYSDSSSSSSSSSSYSSSSDSSSSFSSSSDSGGGW